jgi:hypothetical protein
VGWLTASIVGRRLEWCWCQQWYLPVQRACATRRTPHAIRHTRHAIRHTSAQLAFLLFPSVPPTRRRSHAPLSEVLP